MNSQHDDERIPRARAILRVRLHALNILHEKGIIDRVQLETGNALFTVAADRIINSQRWKIINRTHVLTDERGHMKARIQTTRGGKYRWGVYDVNDLSLFSKPIEGGISGDLAEARYEVECSLSYPIKDGEPRPNPDYDPLGLPIGPIRRLSTPACEPK